MSHTAFTFSTGHSMSTKATSPVTISDFNQTQSSDSFMYLDNMLKLLGEYKVKMRI